jgi:ElaB/YqjD/DUF883 family membrane-anchored ribosome-binding protein
MPKKEEPTATNGGAVEANAKPATVDAPKAGHPKVDATTERVQEATKKLVAEVEKLVASGIDTVQSVATEYAGRLNEGAAHASEHAKKALKEGETYVRDYPVPSVLGAFALGILLGALLRR